MIFSLTIRILSTLIVVMLTNSTFCQPNGETELDFKIFNKSKEVVFKSPYDDCEIADISKQFKFKVRDENKICIEKKGFYEDVIIIDMGFFGGDCEIEIIKKQLIGSITMTISIKNLLPGVNYGLNIAFRKGNYIIDVQKLNKEQKTPKCNKVNYGIDITPINWEEIQTDSKKK